MNVNTFYPTHPHLTQKEVLNSLDSGTRFVQLRAGRKWRKTSLIISWLFEMAWKTHLTCPFVAPNRIQAKNIAWDDHVQRMLTGFKKAGFPYKKNEVELSVTIPLGGKVQLMGVENSEALRGISDWGAFGGDEYDDWTEDIWPTIIRPNLITHSAPAILAGTPKGYSNLYRLEENSDFKSFHYTSYDNPEIPEEELAALEKEYSNMGMDYYRQEILAEYMKPVGTVYAEWNMETNYKPFVYDPILPLHLTWDFGVNDPTAIVFIQPRGSELRVIDYYEASNADLSHFVEVIKDRGYKKPDFESGDIAGRARSLVSGKSPIDELRRLGHHVTTRPIPDIEQQIRNTHKYIPNLFVSNLIKPNERFVECLLNYKYPQKPSTLIDQGNEKPIHNEFSHAMRALEYYCWNRTQGFSGGVREDRTHKPEDLTKKFYMKRDQTGELYGLIDPDKFKKKNINGSVVSS